MLLYIHIMYIYILCIVDYFIYNRLHISPHTGKYNAFELHFIIYYAKHAAYITKIFLEALKILRKVISRQ